LKSFVLHFNLFIFIFIMFGCGSRRDNQVSKVQQAWNARYQYDLENRRIVSRYENQKIGRSIGRDKWGRVNYDRYWVMKPFKGENLIELHKSKLDSQRETRWEEANHNLIEARRLELTRIASNEDENEENNINTNENEEFLPAPFLPQGIDVELIEPMNSDLNGGLPEFRPDAPAIPNAFTPEVAPSPFAPLPPL
jgi:hypothetical protein